MSNQELLQIYSAYLPYGVKVVDDEYKDIHTLFTVCSNNSIVVKNNEDKGVDVLIYGDFKLLLRPLSDLTKEIEHNGERFYPIGKLHNSSYRRQGSVCKSEYEVNEMIPGIITTKKSSFSQGVEVYLNRVDNNKQWIINYLLKWHFDVFDLHSKGLCIYKDEI